MTRKYQHTLELLPKIKEMQEKRGRKPATTLQEYKRKIFDIYRNKDTYSISEMC